MIYKIQCNFKEKSVGEVLSKLESFFNIIFVNNVIYISLKSVDVLKNPVELLKPKRDFFIMEINEENLSFEPEVVRNWVRDHFVRLDLQRFEKEEQLKMKQLLESLDELEKQIDLADFNSSKKGE